MEGCLSFGKQANTVQIYKKIKVIAMVSKKYYQQYIIRISKTSVLPRFFITFE
jgi:hypothetical protein